MYTYEDWFLEEHAELEITSEEYDAFMDGLTFDWAGFTDSRMPEEDIISEEESSECEVIVGCELLGNCPICSDSESEEITTTTSMMDYFDYAGSTDSSALYEYNDDLSMGMGFYDYNEVEALIEQLEQVVYEDLEVPGSSQIAD